MKMRRASLRNLNRRCSRLERAHRSFRLIRSPLFRLRRAAHCADVRLAHPRPFGPEPKIWSVFSVYFRFLPEFTVNSRFCRFFRLFPAISAYFQTVLNWTFGVFAGLSVYCNPQGCSMVTNIDLCVLPIPEEPPDTFPADLPCSGSLHIF